MLKYEFKERRPSAGQQVAEGVTEYKTGFDEFMLTRVVCKEDAPVSIKKESCSIAMVLQGSAKAQAAEGASLEFTEKSAFFVLPGQSLTLSGNAEIFIASCDI